MLDPVTNELTSLPFAFDYPTESILLMDDKQWLIAATSQEICRIDVSPECFFSGTNGAD